MNKVSKTQDQVNKMSYKLYYDGGSRQNPGKSGCGWIIESDSDDEVSGFKYLGIGSNNEAEYKGLVHGLENLVDIINEHKPTDPVEITVYGDSLLVTNQMNGTWKINFEHLRKLNKYAKDLVDDLKKNYKVSVKYVHIKRDLNYKADMLANKAIDLEQ
jgi:ribonuclease HI